jgi:hypothetical protein
MPSRQPCATSPKPAPAEEPLPWRELPKPSRCCGASTSANRWVRSSTWNQHPPSWELPEVAPERRWIGARFDRLVSQSIEDRLQGAGGVRIPSQKLHSELPANHGFSGHLGSDPPRRSGVRFLSLANPNIAPNVRSTTAGRRSGHELRARPEDLLTFDGILGRPRRGAGFVPRRSVVFVYLRCSVGAIASSATSAGVHGSVIHSFLEKRWVWSS